MGAVAGAEPAAEVAGFAYGDAAEVRAYACLRGEKRHGLVFVGWLCFWVKEEGEGKGREGGGEGVVPIIMSHSGFLTRSESGCGSRSVSHFVSSAALISSGVRWRMKTGLPRHLTITYFS